MNRLLAFTLATGTLLAPALGAAKSPPNPDMTGKQEHRMAQCPSTVPTAKTLVTDTREGVELTVTTTDANQAREIRRRAALQANIAAQPARGAIEHTGDGTGSGRMGFCPGMEEGTVITVDDLPNGARIVVRAQAGKDATELRKSTRARLGRLEAKR